MARKPRLHFPGGLYHVMLRGNGGQAIFFDEGDRYHLYLLLQEGVERFGHRIHGFCAMTNHLHLAVQVAEVPLSKIMQNVSFRYTRWINRRQRRSGHLFQGRYKAIVVDADSYLLELVRYIHLNPVRSELVTDPLEYSWSGHRTYLGQEILPWLTTGWVLSTFAKQADVARGRYYDFVIDGIGQGHRAEFHGGGLDGRVLGNDRFVEHTLGRRPVLSRKPLASLDEIERRVCLACDVVPTDLAGPGRRRDVAEARGMIGWLALQCEIGSLREVAERYHRDPSTLTVAARKVAERVRASKQFRTYIKKLGSGLGL